MAVRAVVFDLGGVLERVEEFEETLGAAWRARLGMSPEEFAASLAAIDPGKLAETGQMNEAEYAARCATCLRLSPAQQEEFIADMWDWYCGELDEELMAFAASLRPAVRTAIVSNSADGARREELSRYAFDDVFDPSSTRTRSAWPSPTPGSSSWSARDWTSHPPRRSSSTTCRAIARRHGR